MDPRCNTSLKEYLKQMNRETPTITSSSYSSTAYLGASAQGGGGGGNGIGNVPAGFAGGGTRRISVNSFNTLAGDYLTGTVAGQVVNNTEDEEMTIRVVRVFIIDPNESLALENRVLVKGNEKLTDLTDQELFFELPIGEILTKHNELRAKTMDKVQTNKMGKEIFLEPVRIRDLKMSVVNVAQF